MARLHRIINLFLERKPILSRTDSDVCCRRKLWDDEMDPRCRTDAGLIIPRSKRASYEYCFSKRLTSGAWAEANHGAPTRRAKPIETATEWRATSARNQNAVRQKCERNTNQNSRHNLNRSRWLFNAAISELSVYVSVMVVHRVTLLNECEIFLSNPKRK